MSSAGKKIQSKEAKKRKREDENLRKISICDEVDSDSSESPHPRANDIISLTFLYNNSKECEDDYILASVAPTFTHQLFVDEDVTFLSPSTVDEDISCEIFIR